MVCIYVVGNLASWYESTISMPRDEYPRAVRAVQLIKNDVISRGITTRDVGVHYFRPDDQADYFGSFIYYVLRVSLRYPISFVPYGNSLVRSTQENHAMVYLLCDGFTTENEIPRCIQPFLSRWSSYAPVQKYRVSGTETLVVFKYSPS